MMLNKKFKNILKIGLSLGLIISTSNADTFKEGDTVVVEKGNMICLSTESAYALGGLTKINLSMEIMSFGDETKQFHFPKSPNLEADYCRVDSKDQEFQFKRYENKGFVLLENKDWWVATYENAIKKGKPQFNNNSQNEGPTYNLVNADTLESFPSDYIGKPIFLKCQSTNVGEDKGGRFNISPNCLESNGRYAIMGFNPFKLKVITYDKNTAKEIAKSGNQEKWLLGYLKKNTQQMDVDHIFEVNEVQYK